MSDFETEGSTDRINRLLMDVGLSEGELETINELLAHPTVRQNGMRLGLLRELTARHSAKLMAESADYYFQEIDKVFAPTNCAKVAQELFNAHAQKIVMELAAMEQYGSDLRIKSYSNFTSTDLYKRIYGEIKEELAGAFLPAFKEALEKIKQQSHAKLVEDIMGVYRRSLTDKFEEIAKAKAQSDAKFLFESMQVSLKEISDEAAVLYRTRLKDAPQDSNYSIPE